MGCMVFGVRFKEIIIRYYEPMFGVHMMDWVRSTRKAERRWKVEGRRSPLIQKAGLS